ncbi:DUF2189 domain-containing protein [Paraburkholderia aspalathi]|nr:DUF2189 domain-containing protein [Paraburkholderia aspalathi]
MSQFHVFAGSEPIAEYPHVRKIQFHDVFAALSEGFEDFWAKPSHYVFLCLIYPLAGLFITYWSSGANALPLLFPLMAGFALIGPFAAIGLYEISRRRELHEDTSWRHAFEVWHSPSVPSILAIGALLVAVFIAWLITAQSLYSDLFGPLVPASISALMDQVLYTQQGHELIWMGNAIGLGFALFTLCTTIVAFPLLLDRDVGAAAAIYTSIRVFFRNPAECLLWAAIVVVLLVVGFATLMVGLAIVIPVLGHATWHLYRKTVEAPQRANIR